LICRFNPPKAVSLSLIQPTFYFVQFSDGATDFSLPPDWHQSVNHYSAQARAVQASRAPRMATSYNHDAHFRSQTYPQYAPQLAQAQFGSYSPGGSVPPSYGGGPNPGHTPFQSNPYLSSAFTGMPQQPVYNVTNIYNNPAPQQPQQQEQHQQNQQHSTSSLSKYNGMFTLLGGALKLAGAVLGPTLQNDWSSLTGN
jgi:hypothetical protein